MSAQPWKTTTTAPLSVRAPRSGRNSVLPIAILPKSIRHDPRHASTNQQGHIRAGIESVGGADRHVACAVCRESAGLVQIGPHIGHGRPTIQLGVIGSRASAVNESVRSLLMNEL